MWRGSWIGGGGLGVLDTGLRLGEKMGGMNGNGDRGVLAGFMNRFFFW